MSRPDPIKVYYILHCDNLPRVVEADGLLSDREIREKSAQHTNIGMGSAKDRRLAMPMECHPGTMVGEYVPFYLCPRSIMLYVIFKANHASLAYRGGQEPIVHLEFDARAVVTWAVNEGRSWAVSYGNAASKIARFATGRGCMDRMNWKAIASPMFTDPDIHEAKQSELLVFGHVPWHLVERIGVINQAIRQRVVAALEGAGHRPAIAIRRDWYY